MSPHRHEWEIGNPTVAVCGGCGESREASGSADLRAALERMVAAFGDGGGILSAGDGVCRLSPTGHALIAEAREFLAAQPAAPSVAPDQWREKIASHEPWIGWDTTYCYWCGNGEEAHTEDCVWVAATDSKSPALAGHEHDWETCKQCAEVFDAGRG